MDEVAMGEVGGLPDAGMVDSMDGMDGIDELFGEAGDDLGVAVPLPAAPLPPSVILRVAEMQRIGCCTKLAWSNTGSIARISNDGRKVSFSTLARDGKSAQYRLLKESKYAIEAPPGKQFVHISFNGLGLEVAVVDSQGGVHLYSPAGSINRTHPAAADVGVASCGNGDVNNIVGMHWLRIFAAEFNVSYIAPAKKVNNTWVSSSRKPDPKAPRLCHPGSRQNALLYVTCSSRLTLLYQNEMGVWRAASTQLEVVESSEDLVSHASLCEKDDHFIVVTYDAARRLRVYSVNINWNDSQPSRLGHGLVAVNPSLEVGHLTALEHVSTPRAENSLLSLLRVIASPPQSAENGMHSTCILAVFTHAHQRIEAASQQGGYSTLSRWTIESIVPGLHQGFTKLKQNGPKPLQAATTVLKRQDDIYSAKLILSAESQAYDTLLAFVSSDGTIEYRDRATWHVIEALADTTTASSLPQSGFEHVAGEHHALQAASADGSHIAFIKPDGTLGTKSMIFRYGWQPLDDGVSDNRAFVETAIVCLARQYAIHTANTTANDETLALLPLDLSPEMRTLFVKQIMRIISRAVDISMLDTKQQQVAAQRSANLSRAMSAQMVLDTRPNTMERGFPGQFAYAFLNVKLLATALNQGFTQRDMSAAMKEQIVSSLAGPVKWLLNFYVYMIGSLVEVKRQLKPASQLKDAFEQYAAKTGNPTAYLLLCSDTRMYLRLPLRPIPLYLQLAKSLASDAKSLANRELMSGISEFVRTLPINLPMLPHFLTNFDQAVKQALTDARASSERKFEMEMAMMTEGTIPQEMEPALKALLDTLLPKYFQNTNMERLYFWDTRWLGIEQAPKPGERHYDAIRKTPLTHGAKIRICRRCAAEMEDVPHEQMRQMPPWLHHAHRHCFCQNYWWIE